MVFNGSIMNVDSVVICVLDRVDVVNKPMVNAVTGVCQMEYQL